MFDPGDRWQYGSSIDWVGRIVELISGEPLDIYFREHILDPLGMSDTAFAISPQQRAREASVHRRKLDGSLTPQPTEQQTARAIRLRWRWDLFDGARLFGVHPHVLQGGSLDGVRILHPDTVALMGQNQIGKIEVGVLRSTVPALSNDVDFFPRH